jgi:hypothetical protein
VPAALEDLVEDLGALQLGRQFRRDLLENRFEHGGQPVPDEHGVVDVGARLHRLGAVGVELVEEPTRLVLTGEVEPGEFGQAPPVVASLHDLSLDEHLRPALDLRDVDLRDVVPQLVQSTDALLDGTLVAGLHELGRGELQDAYDGA